MRFPRSSNARTLLPSSESSSGGAVISASRPRVWSAVSLTWAISAPCVGVSCTTVSLSALCKQCQARYANFSGEEQPLRLTLNHTCDLPERRTGIVHPRQAVGALIGFQLVVALVALQTQPELHILREDTALIVVVRDHGTGADLLRRYDEITDLLLVSLTRDTQAAILAVPSEIPVPLLELTGSQISNPLLSIVVHTVPSW